MALSDEQSWELAGIRSVGVYHSSPISHTMLKEGNLVRVQVFRLHPNKDKQHIPRDSTAELALPVASFVPLSCCSFRLQSIAQRVRSCMKIIYFSSRDPTPFVVPTARTVQRTTETASRLPISTRSAGCRPPDTRRHHHFPWGRSLAVSPKLYEDYKKDNGTWYGREEALDQWAHWLHA